MRLRVNLFGVSQFVSDTFPYIRMVLLILMALCAVAMIVSILVQPSNSEGVSAITGQSETFFSKNKSKTLQGAMKRLTIILGVAMFVIAVLFFVSLIIYNPTV